MLPLKQKVNCATKHFGIWAQIDALSIVQHKKIRFLKKKKSEEIRCLPPWLVNDTCQ